MKISAQSEQLLALVVKGLKNKAMGKRQSAKEKLRLRLDRSTALYIYKAKNCKLLAVFTHT